MGFSFGTVGTPTTKKNYLDFLRPAAMVNASAIFKKLQSENGSDIFDALSIASLVADTIFATKGSELDKLWENIEKTLNNRKTLKVAAETPAGKLNTAIGLIYSAIEVIDTGDNINFVRSISGTFNQLRNHIDSRFTGKLEGVEQRTLQRSLDTVGAFLERIIKRFNSRVESGEIEGQEIGG
jgi:hypothetical protein